MSRIYWLIIPRHSNVSFAQGRNIVEVDRHLRCSRDTRASLTYKVCPASSNGLLPWPSWARSVSDLRLDFDSVLSLKRPFFTIESSGKDHFRIPNGSYRSTCFPRALRASFFICHLLELLQFPPRFSRWPCRSWILISRSSSRRTSRTRGSPGIVAHPREFSYRDVFFL